MVQGLLVMKMEAMIIQQQMVDIHILLIKCFILMEYGVLQVDQVVAPANNLYEFYTKLRKIYPQVRNPWGYFFPLPLNYQNNSFFHKVS